MCAAIEQPTSAGSAGSMHDRDGEVSAVARPHEICAGPEFPAVAIKAGTSVNPGRCLVHPLLVIRELSEYRYA